MVRKSIQPVHHAAGNRRHLRRRHHDALDRHRGRHGNVGEGRQRLRRGGRHRLHAAGGRAASQRAGRRCAGHSLRRAQGQAGGDLRPGAGAGRRHHQALPRRTGPRSRPWYRAFGGLCARHVRDLDAAAARLRHHAPCRRARARDRLCARRLSAGRARQRHHRDGGGFVPRALADLGRGLSAGRQGAGTEHVVQ